MKFIKRIKSIKLEHFMLLGFMVVALDSFALDDPKINNSQHPCLDDLKKLCKEKCQQYKGDRPAMKDCIYTCRQENKDKISSECREKIQEIRAEKSN